MHAGLVQAICAPVRLNKNSVSLTTANISPQHQLVLAVPHSKSMHMHTNEMLTHRHAINQVLASQSSASAGKSTLYRSQRVISAKAWADAWPSTQNAYLPGHMKI